MAIFKEPECYQRIDWRLLQNGPVNLYWRQEYLSEDIAALENSGYLIRSFDASSWGTEPFDLHKDFRSKLNFPDYYGNNLNALNDSLSDISIPQETGLAISISNFDLFQSKQSVTSSSLLEILVNASRMAMLFGQRLIILIQTNAPHFQTGPLGETQGNWNRNEWLNESRGL